MLKKKSIANSSLKSIQVEFSSKKACHCRIFFSLQRHDNIPDVVIGSPPIGDYVTPLKKRRLARESVSSEQSFTPPTTPASDKEGARSPDLEEGAVTTPQPPPPAAQIRNAARCVEEAVMVLSADTDFMEQVNTKSPHTCV